MSPERLRVWVARLAAPLAFFFAVTVLVLLVKGGLEREPDALSNGGPTTESVDTVQVPPAPESNPGNEQTGRRLYRVRAGDTLESIADRFDTTVQALLELNPGIDPLALSPRQRIRVR